MFLHTIQQSNVLCQPVIQYKNQKILTEIHSKKKMILLKIIVILIFSKNLT